MSPFKSFKKSGCTSSSSKYALEGANTIGVAVTSTSNETWSSGNYSYIAFRQPGQFTVNRSGKIDICVVGGGGAGGGVDVTNPGFVNYSGGGGGAGGVLQRYGQTFNVGTYYVEIGGGGSAEEPGFGFPSSIQGRPFPLTGIALTAYGGGRGARYPYGVGNGASGGGGSWGSGARGEGNYQSPATGTLIPAPLQPQGYPGGYSNGSTPPSPDPGGSANVGSGGGGAGGPGLSYKNPSTGGAGGEGVSIFGGDTRIPTTYGTAAPPSYAPGRYVGGGGGGGGGTGGGGAGGVGGGASGSSPISPAPIQNQGTPGTKYTGGGGGGAPTNSLGQGGQGGCGLVIIRWKNIISRGD